MMQVTPAVLVFMAVVAMLSMASCFYLFWRLLRYGQVLVYEPRRWVPWGLWGGLAAVALTSISLIVAVGQAVSGDAPPAAEPLSAREFARNMLTLSGVYLTLAAGLVALVVVACKASWTDLGLPTSLSQFVRDIGMGAVLGFASLIPIYIFQILAVYLLGIEASHPILDRISQGPDTTVLLGAMLAATVVAPIFEEIVYRLLLIGALERWEDQITGWPWSLPPRDRFADFDPADEGELTLNGEAQGELLSPHQLPPDDPPLHYPGLLVGLSHGWFPVLVSALLFSLAHLGQGPSPIPLFIFAIIVGYAYQRTHRLLPCVVAHFVFNGLSIALLWLSLSTVES